MSISDRKRRGEWAEVQFMAKASAHGLRVSRPWGDTFQYDFVVDDGAGCLSRVQVKSTKGTSRGRHVINVCGSERAYPVGAFEFLAAFVIPEDAWFIIPAEVIHGYTGIVIHIRPEKTTYAEYRDAWHQFRARRNTKG